MNFAVHLIFFFYFFIFYFLFQIVLILERKSVILYAIKHKK